jgi:hypothetical protein
MDLEEIFILSKEKGYDLYIDQGISIAEHYNWWLHPENVINSTHGTAHTIPEAIKQILSELMRLPFGGRKCSA